MRIKVRRGYSSVVEQQPSKLNMRVRFPLPAPVSDCATKTLARIACSIRLHRMAFEMNLTVRSEQPFPFVVVSPMVHIGGQAMNLAGATKEQVELLKTEAPCYFAPLLLREALLLLCRVCGSESLDQFENAMTKFIEETTADRPDFDAIKELAVQELHVIVSEAKRSPHMKQPLEKWGCAGHKGDRKRHRRWRTSCRRDWRTRFRRAIRPPFSRRLSLEARSGWRGRTKCCAGNALQNRPSDSASERKSESIFGGIDAPASPSNAASAAAAPRRPC